jgi:hypothetical protein
MLRLDQTAALFEVLKAAQRGEPSPDQGSHRIRQIVDMRPLGDQALGGYLSGFVGAIVMTPVAYIVERRPSGPPPAGKQPQHPVAAGANADGSVELRRSLGCGWPGPGSGW